VGGPAGTPRSPLLGHGRGVADRPDQEVHARVGGAVYEAGNRRGFRDPQDEARSPRGGCRCVLDRHPWVPLKQLLAGSEGARILHDRLPRQMNPPRPLCRGLPAPAATSRSGKLLKSCRSRYR
jgi:hypothetical protein